MWDDQLENRRREMLRSGERCTAADCWPQCQYSWPRCVHVLGPGSWSRPRHVSWLTSLNWLPPAAAVTRLVAGAASPDQWPHSPHCSSWLVPPTLTFSSCSRWRSCHDQPNLTRSPSCFKNATFMRSDWRTRAKWVAASSRVSPRRH